MNVTVVGTGYVGLVTGSCLAHFGLSVTCVDVDEEKIGALKAGRIPIYEPGLEEIVQRNAAEGRLHFSTDVAGAMPGAEVVFLAVGTPPRPDGGADLTYVFQAVDTFSANRGDGCQVLVTKSTVPVGTGSRIEAELRGKNPEGSFAVVSNPEFLREGCAVSDFLNPDRIIIGVDDARAKEILTRLYKPLIDENATVLFTSRVSAELIKYASNAMLATRISFINEVSRLCECVGADIQEVAKGMGLDPRIGPSFLQCGPGYGGSCFPKDTRALLDIAASRGIELEVVRATVRANDAQVSFSLSKVEEAVGDLTGKTVALLGLAFKQDTDDIRQSPAMKIARAMVERGCTVRSYDPAAMDNAKEALTDIVLCKDPYDAADGADGLVVATEWGPFKRLDWSRLKDLLEEPVVVDLRNLYDPDEVREKGFRYTSVGRP